MPAIVAPEVFAAVQEQLRDNQRHARQARRGALYLLQGLVQCQHCGYAYYGKHLSPSARQGKPHAYAYYRCLGTDAYRFGGERVCQNTQVRTDLLDLAVWQEVWYSPETWVTVSSRDMGHSVTILMGTQGGARCPGVKQHPWTKNPNSSPMICVTVFQ